MVDIVVDVVVTEDIVTIGGLICGSGVVVAVCDIGNGLSMYCGLRTLLWIQV